MSLSARRILSAHDAWLVGTPSALAQDISHTFFVSSIPKTIMFNGLRLQNLETKQIFWLSLFRVASICYHKIGHWGSSLSFWPCLADRAISTIIWKLKRTALYCCSVWFSSSFWWNQFIINSEPVEHYVLLATLMHCGGEDLAGTTKGESTWKNFCLDDHILSQLLKQLKIGLIQNFNSHSQQTNPHRSA